MLELKDYIKGIEKGDISILARAITLCESQKKEHQELAIKLLSKLKTKNHALVLGISGTPGVGKSTFIEAFGLELIGLNKKVAVLAVDPTSEVTGGSILGDKTRMNELSTKAFIRPSPSGKTLGGVANKTREAIQLCEAFGFDIILVETVGVGQSEAQVSKLVDIFMLLMQPGAGDDLQAIKRGILELADYLIVNKADGELLSKAKLTKTQLEGSLEILRHKKMPIQLVSALKKEGIKELANNILGMKNDFATKRAEQRAAWLSEVIDELMIRELIGNENYLLRKEKLMQELINNKKSLEDIGNEMKKGLSYGS
tara:strand:+ start:13739 stop:14680 length:942 start_codon:yes stop_codon:yes gene_type:complete